MDFSELLVPKSKRTVSILLNCCLESRFFLYGIKGAIFVFVFKNNVIVEVYSN